MAYFVINADYPGSYSESVGHNGSADTVTINIGPGFSGTIAVQSSHADNEFEHIVINHPPDWEVRPFGGQIVPGEAPPMMDWSYHVVNADGLVIGTLSIRGNTIDIIPCFTAGTLIETPEGPRAVETLLPGDPVLTRDHGAQPLRWIGRRRLGADELAARPHLRPIRIRAGALGVDCPSSDLLVSPQHRILIRSAVAQRMFGAAEVLVAARQLLVLDGIEVATDMDQVEYVHILFDRHEIVISNGAETESLYTGGEALKSVGAAARAEILSLFPELAGAGFIPVPARPLSSGRQGRNLAARHLRNDKPLVA
mgnify:CR=1 FL=1